MRKKGLSMISMVIYVVLFFVFSAFAVTIGINLNYKALYEKGNVWINEQYQKLQFNLISSAKASDLVQVIDGKVVFSNGDEYVYDESTYKVLKNGGIVASDVKDFNVIRSTDLVNAPSGFSSNLDPDIKNFSLEVTFTKYTKQLTFQLFTVVGDDSHV